MLLWCFNFVFSIHIISFVLKGVEEFEVSSAQEIHNLLEEVQSNEIQ